MRSAMPNMSESLSYSIAAATGITILGALVLIAVSGNLVAALLVLALAVGIYWLVGRNLTMIVTAKEVAAAIALLLTLSALADLATGYPYQGVLFLLAAVALGFALLLLHQGTLPAELRIGGMPAVVAASSEAVHLRMLEELHDAGILTADELAAKRLLVGR
ncbi:MAG TPA: hypothetical protein VGQ90_16715 [Stellaceae bacterium]|nr:hypothetical protein [Stellaceae bacterium]